MHRQCSSQTKILKSGGDFQHQNIFSIFVVLTHASYKSNFPWKERCTTAISLLARSTDSLLNIFSRLRVLARKKIKEGVVLISKHICGFSDHIKAFLLQKGGPLFG